MDDVRYAKRARQACEPCRRKKAKCPGERPACSYCERLGQPCVYNSPGDITDTPQSRQSREMETRLSSLEGRMDRLIQQLSPDPPFQQSAESMAPTTASKLESKTMPDARREIQTTKLHSNQNDLLPHDTSPLVETGRLYLTWSHCQPITIFIQDEFLESLPSRDTDLVLMLEAIALRFPPAALTPENEHQANAKAQSARRMVMERVTEGRVELSTLQSLCLLSIFDFGSGNVTRSGLNLSIASHLAHSIPPSSNPRNDQERKLCLASIVALQNLQGCIIPSASLTHNATLASACTAPDLASAHLGQPHDRDIVTLASHFSITWRMARAYATSRVGPDSPPPWDSRSDYSMVMQAHHDIDCRASVRYRFANNRINNFSAEEIQSRRHWWMPFLFIQFVHETIPCLLNHPFLLSMRLRSFRETVPVHFMQQSFEAINRNAGWVIYFVDVLEKKGIQVSDPVLAHCVVIVATIHLQHSFVQDPVLKGKAEVGFEKCMRFLRKMADIWPAVANMVNNLSRLKDSVVVKPSPEQGDPSSHNRFSINSQLLWDLLIYDRAVRPDAGRDQSMFGPSLQSQSDTAGQAAEERAAEFDLIGSAGISAHQAMPNQAAVWAPSEEHAHEVAEEAQLDETVGEFGTSFEDMFFEGVGPFGEQANRFFDGNDYGRAIDDWLNFEP